MIPLRSTCRLVLLSLCMCCVVPAMAQFAAWEDFLEQLLLDDDAEGLRENLYDDYVWMHAHPIPINSADSAQLQRLGFLTDLQIESLLHYIYRYGAIRSVGELMLIPELDYHTRQLLSYFVTFAPPEQPHAISRDTWRRMLTKGRSELSTRTDVPLYRRAGYAPRTQSELDAHPSRYYMGSALYHNLRYTYRYGTRLSWGLSAEKDAGEPLLVGLRPDYLSGYVQLSDVGVLKDLVVGNYRLRFGQGLVMNSDFALGKEMLLQGLSSQSASINPHRGTSEGDYYTGVAATVVRDVWTLTAFASCRSFDATLDGVSISTLKTDGYHRTPTELSRRGNTLGTLFGTHLGYSAHGLHLGATALYQTYNRAFAPSTRPYRLYYPQGNAFANVSIDYAWYHHLITLSGETAIDGKGAMATLNTLRLKATDKLHLTLLQRHYARDYWALEGKSFSTSSDVRNEQGLYLGAEWQPSRKLQLTTYVDAYRFPYLRYQVSAPSVGTDASATLRYTPSRGHALSLRYRYRLKQRDAAESSALIDTHTHRLRLRWDGTLTPTLTLQALLECCALQAESLSAGYLMGLQGAYSPTQGSHAWRISSGLASFRADYAARLYGYEQGLLYAYNYQTYYGTGLRTFLLVQYSHRDAPRLTTTAKLGSTYYLDRPTISSGAAMIDACHREDVQLQVRYTF